MQPRTAHAAPFVLPLALSRTFRKEAKHRTQRALRAASRSLRVDARTPPSAMAEAAAPPRRARNLLSSYYGASVAVVTEEVDDMNIDASHLCVPARPSPAASTC